MVKGEQNLKRIDKILIIIGCTILVLVSWITVLSSKSDKQKQLELIKEASNYINDEIYVFAVPLLEEAISYNTELTCGTETELKKTYLKLNQREYINSYINLLEKQMNRKDAIPEVFFEAAEFYFNGSEIQEALTILKNGIEKTGNEKLIDFYEENRYSYTIGCNKYEDVTDTYGITIGVKAGGLWGVAMHNGILVIPCQYDKISTFSGDRVIVQKDDVIYAVNSDNNRVALLKTKVLDFGNLAGGLTSLLIDEGWVRANGEFGIGSIVYEDIGTYSNNHVAVKKNGKWGIIDASSKWTIEPQYDEIKMDELGRAYSKDSVFVRKGSSINLIVNGSQVGESYEDAKPFGNENYAAVKKNGKWGFIDTSGKVKIDYQFDDALSFSQHLAAVKQGDLWGYISLKGDVVIKPVFLQVKNFVNGSAPVLTELGWQFITLNEYIKGAGL